MLSLGIFAILAVALVSTLVLSARAMSIGGLTGAAQSTGSAATAGQVVSDLQVAYNFTEQTASAVKFSVPDRNGDGQPETVRYAWSGAAGSTITVGGVAYAVPAYTLTREYNGGAPATVATNVRAFALAYQTRTQGRPAPVESAEQVLVSHDGGSGSNVKAYAEKNNAWPAECFKPNWPANTTSLKITHVKLQVARASSTATGTITLQIYQASSKLPTGSVLVSVPVDVTTLSTTKGWVDFALASPLSGLDPTQGYCVALATTASAPASVYYDSTSTDTAIAYTTLSNSGSSWAAVSTGSALQIQVYGTYTTQAP